MKNKQNAFENMLNTAVSGFHIYSLHTPYHIIFASDDLLNMLWLSQKELVSKKQDLYINFIHEDDREKYLEFLNKLAQKEQKLCLEYRLIKKDGSKIYVSDCMISKYDEKGFMQGVSTLCDISALKSENNSLSHINAAMPLGIVKYSCENQPRISFMNEKMREILRFPPVKEGEVDYLELCKENIYLLIPMEERTRFANFLSRVYTQGIPLAGELTALRCDGTKAYLFGWASKTTDENGETVFQSVCMDMTDSYYVRKDIESKRYVKALSEVYDKIFEFDHINNTIRYLHGNKQPMYRFLENIAMQVHEVIEKWAKSTVHNEDRERVLKFFSDYAVSWQTSKDTKPPQISFRALSSSGQTKTYNGIFLKSDNAVSLFCVRTLEENEKLSSLRIESEAAKNLSENMQELVSLFTEGIAGFEVTGDIVKPLYASDNVCEFFGFTKEEWLVIMKEGTPLKDFVAQSGSSYESFLDLLEKGESEFSYFDISKNSERRIKAICSKKGKDPTFPRYIMLYNVDDKELKKSGETSVSIRTFGYFDVFVGDKPIAFRTQKAKELFALLVDRKGGYVSSEEIISFLWEDEPVNSVTLARSRKVALRLKNILEEYGISDIVESVDGKRRLVTEKVKCDLYDYLSGKDEYAQLFKGSYLSNYSWAETTLGELTNGDKYE